MNKIMGIIVGIVLIVGIIVILSKKTDTTVPEVPETSTKSYTLSEVAMHKDTTSCWSAVNGKVYDLTNWINNHPGGKQAVLSICGKDGSVAFNTQHTGDVNPAKMLASFIIGDLK